MLSQRVPPTGITRDYNTNTGYVNALLTSMVIPELSGITTVYATHSQGTAFETLLALNYNSFILTVATIGVGIYSIEAGGQNVFDSHARDMYMYSEAMLNIVVYQMLIVTNVPVNSAALQHFMQCVTLL